MSGWVVPDWEERQRIRAIERQIADAVHDFQISLELLTHGFDETGALDAEWGWDHVRLALG